MLILHTAPESLISHLHCSLQTHSSDSLEMMTQKSHSFRYPNRRIPGPHTSSTLSSSLQAIVVGSTSASTSKLHPLQAATAKASQCSELNRNAVNGNGTLEMEMEDSRVRWSTGSKSGVMRTWLVSWQHIAWLLQLAESPTPMIEMGMHCRPRTTLRLSSTRLSALSASVPFLELACVQDGL